MTYFFQDRDDAGERLAAALSGLGLERPVVLGIPRGGVPVAARIARALGGDLGVVVARKIGAPGYPELAIGAVTADGSAFVNEDLAIETGADRSYLEAEIRAQVAEARRREALFDQGRRPPVAGRPVIVVDDGVATGATAIAAARSLRRAGASRVILAFPVGSPRTIRMLRREADDVICLIEDPAFRAVGEAYVDFRQIEDDEVKAILDAFYGAAAPAADERPVEVEADGVLLAGDLTIPEGAQGVVLFAHGSGSSRLSPRNRFVARMLNEAGLATLLIDLLTPEEEAIDERTRELRFDIDLLARRLESAACWLAAEPATRHLAIGLFGASTGAAAALVTAAATPGLVGAVVSRGGRPDLAGGALRSVRAPTLLIVGGRDEPVIELNLAALDALACEKRLEIVEGATHLFEEPGTLEEVGRLAADWFVRHLAARGREPRAPRPGGTPRPAAE